MRRGFNPFRSEADAFRLLLYTAGYLALIVLGALVHTWVGVGVFVALTLVAAWALLRKRAVEDEPRLAPAQATPADECRIVVVANETLGGAALHDAIRDRAGGRRTKVYVVAPMQTSPLQHVTSDDRAAREDAHARLEASLRRLREAGFEADGMIGDEDPLTALEDGLRIFGADEIVISTHPEGQSHWLEKGVVQAAREHYALPVTHVVVHGAGDHAEVRA